MALAGSLFAPAVRRFFRSVIKQLPTATGLRFDVPNYAFPPQWQGSKPEIGQDSTNQALVFCTHKITSGPEL
jgi:hypothetical protein